MSGSVEQKEANSNPVIYDEQGILLYNLVDITKNRPTTYDLKTEEADPAKVSDLYQAFLKTKNELPNICLIDTNTPSTFLNLLKGDPKRNDILLRLSTFELSSLVPLIRVFKIFYNKSTKEQIILELPFDTKADEKSIFESSVGRGTGAGVSSIEWRQNPKNEANTNTFRVALKLHLQNVEEFFKTRNSISTSSGEYTVQIQDLLYKRKTERQKIGDGSAVYDPEDYEIKVVVGWQISSDMLEEIRANSTRTPEETKQLTDALQEQKESFYLTFVSHTMEFNEDGSLDLHIDYFGRSETKMSNINTSNVLNLGKEYENKLNNLKNRIAQLQEDKKTNFEPQSTTYEDFLKAQGKFGMPQTYSEFVDKVGSGQFINQEAIDQELESLNKEIESMHKNAKIKKFNHLFRRLYQKQYLQMFGCSKEEIEKISKLTGKLKFSSYTDIKNITDFINKREEIKSRSQEQERQKGNKLVPLIEGVSNSNLIRDLAQLPIINTQTIDQINRLENAEEQEQQLFEILNSREITKQIANSANSSKNNPHWYGKYQITFFYLSSLVEVLMESILNDDIHSPNFISKSTRVILGPMTIFDYGSLVSDGRTYKIFDSVEAETEGKEKYVKIYTGQPVTINIGDIPISLKDFNAWFNQKYVNKDKQQVTLNEFLTDLISELVITSINNQVYPFAPKQKSKFVIDSFTSVTSPKNESAFINKIANYKADAGGFRILQNSLESLKTKSSDIFKDHDSNDQSYLPNKDYVIVYCLNDAPYERIGDYEADKKDGILHLYAGESRGTIRNIKFSRIDNPRRQTANILAEQASGKAVSKVIRERYNTNIEMFGNINIQAGTHVFLKPTYSGYSGIGKTEELLRDLGLGGYYMITEVRSLIETGEFSTSIKGIWTAFGNGTINDGEKEYQLSYGVEPTMGVVR